MTRILFVTDTSSIIALMAGALAEKLARPALAISAAVPSESENAKNRQILRALGLPWPENIIPFSEADIFKYDLVIALTPSAAALCPALPGSPPLVGWQLPEALPENAADADAWGKIKNTLQALVLSLFEQGYLSSLLQAAKNANLLMDNLHEGIIAHDLNRRIFYFNKAAEKITGYQREEIVGHDCHVVFPDKFCRSNCSFCEGNVPANLPDRPYPLTITSKSGEERQLEMSVVSINDFFANPIGVVASFRDVTRETALAARLGEIEQFSGIIGRDAKMLELFEVIREVADSNVSVLIQGESGTGKELVAAAIHNEGGRAERLFVPVNCGALPENLLESELFGHVKGAFTGAIRDKKGRFELADGGTIFLDEIGDITPAMQVKLLRVLQDGVFSRLGSEESIKVDVRVIAATHKDIQKEIAAGRFREDLFYRLCVVPLTLPPLRDRKNDIPLLAEHFLKKNAAVEKRAAVTIAPEAMDMLLSYDWPGNVRELQNVIRYMLVRCREEMIKPHHLPQTFLDNFSHAVRIRPKGHKSTLTVAKVRDALQSTGNNRSKAAKLLGVGRATLYRFLDQHQF